jgi:type II secretory ATPase GspE/PulE/Tfp pilus assembly ATPase PilB-like protein
MMPVRLPATTGSTEQEIRDQIRQTGTPSLTTDALTKAASGLTSLDEARKMTWA